jgi:hypothetical protein
VAAVIGELRAAVGAEAFVEAYQLRDVVSSTMVFDASATAPLLEGWVDSLNAPHELTSCLSLFAQRGEPPIVGS